MSGETESRSEEGDLGQLQRCPRSQAEPLELEGTILHSIITNQEIVKSSSFSRSTKTNWEKPERTKFTMGFPALLPQGLIPFF